MLGVEISDELLAKFKSKVALEIPKTNMKTKTEELITKYVEKK